MTRATPNDPKLSDREARHDACAAGSAGSRQHDVRSGSLQRMVRRFGFWVISIGVHLLRSRLSGLRVDDANVRSCDSLGANTRQSLAVKRPVRDVWVRKLHPNLDVAAEMANLFEFLDELRESCRRHWRIGDVGEWAGKRVTIAEINREAGIACVVSVNGERQPAALCNLMPLIESKV